MLKLYIWQIWWICLKSVIIVLGGMEWVASTLHTTSEHGVFSITTADAHTSAASRRLNWRPRRFKWTRPFPRKTKLVSARVPSHFKRSLPKDQCSSRPCEMICKVVRFYGEGFLAPLPPLKLEDHQLSSVRDWLFNIFAATLRIRRPFLHPQPENAPCCGDKDPLMAASWPWEKQELWQ